jgi:polysaccharide transporter, PST family
VRVALNRMIMIDAVSEPIVAETLKLRLIRILRNDIVHNSAALYGVQLCRKIFPLVTMPYLARVLGPSEWGSVAFAGSLGEFIVLLIEFGFNLSATREIAQGRHLPAKCSGVMAGVIGAQVLLATGAVSAAWFASRFIPLLRDNPYLLWAGLFYGVCQGMNPLWFFQGLERLRLAAFIEIAGKVLGMICVFLFVRRPGDGWEALLFQAVPPMLSTAIGLTLAYRYFPFTRPTFALVRVALKSGWRLFVFRSGESLYGAGNAFILGLFAPAAAVGYFAIAEKISKAVFGLLNPIREALYPRISRLAASSAKDAAGLARIGAAVMITSGFALGVALYIFAPQLIHLMTGSDFLPAVTVLRILSPLPLLLSVTYSVGLQWLLPFGEDAVVNRIILTAGALNLVLAFLVAPTYQHIGMAVSVLISEIYVCIRMVLAVLARSPFWQQKAFRSTQLAGRPEGDL